MSTPGNGGGAGNSLSNRTPLATFLLLSYNQVDFIRKAIDAAFAQDYSNLEIILSDDCSQDGTFELMEEAFVAYRGRHAVRLNRNEFNLGIGAHVNKAVALARGELLVFAAGDDLSYPNRVSILVDQWMNFLRPWVMGSLMAGIDERDGVAQELHPYNVAMLGYLSPTGRLLISAEEYLEKRLPPVLGATAAYSRDVFDEGGLLSPLVAHEDEILTLRGLCCDSIYCVKESLVGYRQHSGSLTNKPALPSHRFCESPKDVEAAEHAFLSGVEKDKSRTERLLEELDSLERRGLIKRDTFRMRRALHDRLHQQQGQVEWWSKSLAEKLLTFFSALLRFRIREAKWFFVRCHHDLASYSRFRAGMAKIIRKSLRFSKGNEERSS